LNDYSFFSAPQLKRASLGGDVSPEPIGIRNRLLRMIFVGVLGAGLGFIVGLSLATRLWFVNGPNPLLLATLVGAALGTVSGFLFSDYQWKRVLRVMLPFSRWP